MPTANDLDTKENQRNSKSLSIFVEANNFDRSNVNNNRADLRGQSRKRRK